MDQSTNPRAARPIRERIGPGLAPSARLGSTALHRTPCPRRHAHPNTFRQKILSEPARQILNKGTGRDDSRPLIDPNHLAVAQSCWNGCREPVVIPVSKMRSTITWFWPPSPAHTFRQRPKYRLPLRFPDIAIVSSWRGSVPRSHCGRAGRCTRSNSRHCCAQACEKGGLCSLTSGRSMSFSNPANSLP